MDKHLILTTNQEVYPFHNTRVIYGQRQREVKQLLQSCATKQQGKQSYSSRMATGSVFLTVTLPHPTGETEKAGGKVRKSREAWLANSEETELLKQNNNGILVYYKDPCYLFYFPIKLLSFTKN